MPNYDFVYVGAGSSVAYYLESLPTLESDKRKILEKTMLIGTVDNWDVSVRGPGWINQWMQLLGHWSDGVPIYNEKFADREEFSGTNAQVIQRAEKLGMTVLKHWVSSISRETVGVDTDGRKKGETWYKIESKPDANSTAMTNYARKVIVGMGSGPHAKRTTIKPGAELRAINIDEFMVKMKDAQPTHGTVVIQGAFAAVDGAKRANDLGFDIIWLIRDTPPNFLAGRGDTFKQIETIAQTAANLDKISGDPAENAKIFKNQLIKGVSNVEVNLDQSGNDKILLTCKTKDNKTFGLTADYYCYALGPDAFAAGALGQVLSDDIRKLLKPIYDINQCYTDRPFETVLGLKVDGTTSTAGLEIVGAGANALHSKVAPGSPVLHNYLDIWTMEFKTALEIVQAQIGEKVTAPEIKQNLLACVKEIADTTITELDGADSKRAKWLDDKQSTLALSLAKVNETDADAARKLRGGFSAFINAWKQVQQANYYFSTVKPRLIQEKKDAGSNVSDNVKALDIEFENQTRFMSLAFVNADQLGPVKNSIAALSAVMPAYVIPPRISGDGYILERGKVNFSMDSRTVLATYIAWNYPNISAKDAEAFIAKVVEARRIQQFPEKNVKGFNSNQVGQLETALQRMEKQQAGNLDSLSFLNAV